MKGCSHGDLVADRNAWIDLPLGMDIMGDASDVDAAVVALGRILTDFADAHRHASHRANIDGTPPHTYTMSFDLSFGVVAGETQSSSPHSLAHTDKIASLVFGQLPHETTVRIHSLAKDGDRFNGLRCRIESRSTDDGQ